MWAQRSLYVAHNPVTFCGMDPISPLSTADTTYVGTPVAKHIADALTDLARRHERSTAAELRLAIKAWLDANDAQAAA